MVGRVATGGKGRVVCARRRRGVRPREGRGGCWGGEVVGVCSGRNCRGPVLVLLARLLGALSWVHGRAEWAGYLPKAGRGSRLFFFLFLAPKFRPFPFASSLWRRRMAWRASSRFVEKETSKTVTQATRREEGLVCQVLPATLVAVPLRGGGGGAKSRQAPTVHKGMAKRSEQGETALVQLVGAPVPATEPVHAGRQNRGQRERSRRGNLRGAQALRRQRWMVCRGVGPQECSPSSAGGRGFEQVAKDEAVLLLNGMGWQPTWTKMAARPRGTCLHGCMYSLCMHMYSEREHQLSKDDVGGSWSLKAPEEPWGGVESVIGGA